MCVLSNLLLLGKMLWWSSLRKHFGSLAWAHLRGQSGMSFLRLRNVWFRRNKIHWFQKTWTPRYLVFNFCKQECRFPSILSLDNWLPAAKGSVYFLLGGPSHPPQVPFLSWPCPHHPQNRLCRQGSVLQQHCLFLGKSIFPEVRKSQEFPPDFHERACLSWPGEFHGLCSPWGRTESDTTERLSLHTHAAIYKIDSQPGATV